MSILNAPFEAFLQVIRHGTVLSAARALHLTQTAVTQRIKALEKEMGATLFIRSRKGMRLTKEGEVLFRYGTAAKELSNQAQEALRSGGKSETIRISIAGPTSIMRSRVSAASMRVMKKFPQLLTSLLLTDSDDLGGWINNGRAQLVILPTERVTNEMDSKVLEPEQWVLIGSPQWENRKLNEIVAKERIIDFDESDEMTFLYLKTFKLIQKIRRERLYVNNTESLVEFIHKGFAYSALTLEFAEKYLRKNHLILLNEPQVYRHSLSLAWHPRPEMPLYFQTFIDELK